MDGTSLRWRDGLLPLGLAVLVVVELLALDMDGRLGAGIALVAGCAALVPRRVHPVASGIAVGVCCAGVPWLGPAVDEVATPILMLAVASYSMARWVRGYAGLAGVAVTLALLSFDYVAVDVRAHNITDAVFLLALLVPPYVFGRVTRRLADYNDLLRREQELVRQAAASSTPRARPGSRSTRSSATLICTTIALTEWAMTSCSSRAIRSRSSRTAACRTSSCSRRSRSL